MTPDAKAKLAKFRPASIKTFAIMDGLPTLLLFDQDGEPLARCDWPDVAALKTSFGRVFAPGPGDRWPDPDA